jgi:hypothetical protein
MFKMRMKDLALVAVAGGLLAFELVSISEAVPAVKKALAGHGLSGKSLVASASAAAARAPAIDAAASPASSAESEAVAVAGYAHRVAAVTAPTQVKQCLVVTRTRSAQRSRPRVRFVSLKSGGSCSTSEVAISVERVRELSKAVDLALKHSTL